MSDVPKVKPDRGPYDCWDCHGLTPSYMIHNELWLQAMPDYRTVRGALLREFKHSDPSRCHVLLCFPCLERRLGRRLVLEDFTGAPINEAIRFAHAMGRTSTVSIGEHPGWVS